jgi:hypothetical protein
MVRRRLAALALVVVIVTGFGQSALATTTSTIAGEGAATTTLVGETTTTSEPIIPAVSTEVTEPPETQPDWTYRFFIPTLLVIAALVVIATVVRYFTGVVRKRYRVIR